MPRASSYLLHVCVLKKPNIKRSPNRIKTDGKLFWNIWDFLEEESTRKGVRGGHKIGGRALESRGPPVRRLTLLFCRKKANFMRKIWAKDSAQSDLRISCNIRNGEREESGNAKIERDRETDPISEGLSPLPCHGRQGPEGKTFSHLGRRSRKNETKGPPLPFSSGGTGTLPWPSSSSSPRSTPTPPPSSPTSPSPSPFYL